MDFIKLLISLIYLFDFLDISNWNKVYFHHTFYNASIFCLTCYTIVWMCNLNFLQYSLPMNIA